MRKHTFWLKTTAVFQVITALLHSIGFVTGLQPTNETEKQMLGLMNNYKLDAGAGFHPTMQDLFTSLSACQPLLYIFGATSTLYLLRKKVDIATLRGMANINLIIFGTCFFVMLFLSFLPPVLCTGLVFLCLIIARLCFPGKGQIE